MNAEADHTNVGRGVGFPRVVAVVYIRRPLDGLLGDCVLDLYPAPHPEAGIERVGGRLLAVSTDDHLHSFIEDDDTPSHTAERIVELSDGRHTVREIAAVVRGEFDDAPPLGAIEDDVVNFVNVLVARHVLIVTPHAMP